MNARRRTTGVPMLARPRRPCVPLTVRRHRALSEAVIWGVDIGMCILLALFTGHLIELWVRQ
jgi:hypothetical protein